jgi:hypothetical protein
MRTGLLRQVRLPGKSLQYPAQRGHNHRRRFQGSPPCSPGQQAKCSAPPCTSCYTTRMPETFEHTRLWQSTLAVVDSADPHAVERERLRASFTSFRSRVAVLASEIHRLLPDYTVHDISHLDSLWEIAELIAGPTFEITPTEAYVLGGAFLLHDLGMALASYPGGIDDLKKEPSWSDVVVQQFTARFGRAPQAEEVSNPPREVQDAAVGTLLRLLHARHAEQLATAAWKLENSDVPLYLIEDSELRQAFGRMIGRIAHSHWWPVERLDDEFSRMLGAPYWCPKTWTIDPLKLAALLRLADAAHIDARRAPAFLRRVRKPAVYSDRHWQFQEKLQKPHASEDALVFTSGYAFSFAEAPAWWLCFETLEMIDDELRRVDALLADKKLARFAARRVAGVDSPERLVAYVPTEGWFPVNAALQVSDLPRVIENLGGAELYGRDLRVPVRELIQNAADAVRARRIVDERPVDWGAVTVVLGSDNDGEWLEIHDTGLGMSREVLTRYLLDFGTTYWGSGLMLSEFPGLMASGFRPTGKYGIGFFSIFMLGDAVRVTTRRYDAAQSDTLILEFNTGILGRPILRPAGEHERLRDGGTVIRVWLRLPARDNRGLLARHMRESFSLAEFCACIAPSLDVDLHAGSDGGALELVIKANDWLSINPLVLLQRTHDWSGSSQTSFRSVCDHYTVQSVAVNVRPIVCAGSTVGRAALIPSWLSIEEVNFGGVVTVGGLTASNLVGIAGCLLGASRRAARDIGRPIATFESLSPWATEQATLAFGAFEDPDDRLPIASAVWRLGGSTGPLPIGLTKKGFRTAAEIAEDFKEHREVLIGSNYIARKICDLAQDATFVDNVIFTESSFIGVSGPNGPVPYLWPTDADPRWTHIENARWRLTSIHGAIISALADAWNVSIAQLLPRDDESWRGMEERVIARAGQREISEPVTIIRRIDSVVLT